MIDVLKHTTEYFRPPSNYFWQWGDNGEVIEWKNNATICYRDDLVFILNSLTSQGFPPLSPILMVLAACNDSFPLSGGKDLLTATSKALKSYNTIEPDKEVIEYHLHYALKFMDNIAALPKELRSGRQRIHLIQEVFEPTTFIISETPFKNIVDELSSGQLDKIIYKEAFAVPWDTFKSDLQYLSKAYQKYPTTESLELKLKTGLDKIPGPVRTDIPESSPLDLFDQLSEDSRTAGLARLAKRIIAALNIPLHVQGSSDLSFGGISDITNRGSYDRLLLSELAHDDVLLTARLVNNEALYFRREAPPDNPKRQRTILLDTSIRMWGIPRVFAVSAALACAHNTKHGESVAAYSLGGKNYTAIHLSAKEGIIKALGLLDPALHCGTSLDAVIKEMTVTIENENIFITEEEQLRTPDFLPFFSHARDSLQYIITVNRQDELKFYSCSKGRMKLLSAAKFDLEELLFAQPVPSGPVTVDDPLPAFFNVHPAPLYFPEIRIKLSGDRLLVIENTGLLVVNETQRVLFIEEKQKGAKEFIDYIEKGDYTFGFGYAWDFYIMVNNCQRKFLKFYKIDNRSGQVKSVNLSDEIQFAKKIIFHKEKCYIETEFSSFVFDCESMKVERTSEKAAMAHYFANYKGSSVISDYRPIFSFLDTGYNILYKIRDIHVSGNGELGFGRHYLNKAYIQHDHISIVEKNEKGNKSKYANLVSGHYTPLRNKHIKFNKRVWADGSEAIVESRGLLHLKSSDPSLPEISIILVIGRVTACWASNGDVCGSSHFTGVPGTKNISSQEFYEKYIQKFIDRLC